MTKLVNKNNSDFDVYIGRGSKYGNPFTHKEIDKTKALVQVKTRSEAIECYEKWLLGIIKIPGLYPPAINIIRNELKNKTIACFCPPKKCHGEILLTHSHN